jgi:hypothetical protein
VGLSGEQLQKTTTAVTSTESSQRKALGRLMFIVAKIQSNPPHALGPASADLGDVLGQLNIYLSEFDDVRTNSALEF